MQLKHAIKFPPLFVWNFTTGTSYILQQTINGCFSSDTVTIGVLVPLKFISFTAKIQPNPNPSKEGNVLLQWQTANEINVSHFNIQRSTNGVSFTTIGKVVAQNKSINSYEFIDANLPSLEGLGVGLFYRIQSIDKDGKISYSEVKQIRLNQLTNNPINIYPNPSKGEINIDFNKADAGLKQFTITDIYGKTVWQQQSSFSSGILKANLNVANGIYFLNINNNKNNTK